MGLLIILLLTSQLVSAAKESKLKEFKEEVTTEAESQTDNHHAPHPHYQQQQSLCEWLFEELFWEPIFHPRRSIISRSFINVVTYPYAEPYHNLEVDSRLQKTGSKQSLKLVTGITRQYVNNNDFDVQTAAWRVDTSLIYHRLSFDVAQTRYKNNLGEELNFNQILLSYIFAKNQNWQFKTGIGWEEIAGVNGFKYQYVIDYQRQNLMADLAVGLTRLTTAKTVFEIASGIGYSEQFFSTKLGYRFKAVGDDILVGPELTTAIKF